MWRVGLGLALMWAQQSIRDSVIAFGLLSVSYAGYFPQLDLARRFGYTGVVGGEIGYKTRVNLYFLLQGGGLIGDQVREPDFLAGLHLQSFWQTGSLAFVDENGRVFSPNLRQRGWQGSFRIGYIAQFLRLPGQNPNCGPFVELGLGYLRHRILIDKARSDRLPLLEGEYLKGLDRLSAGWGLTESLGYRFFANRGLINFFLAFEAGQFFTRSLRYYVYDQRKVEDRLRRDFWYGFRFGWSLLLYEKAPVE